MTPINCTSEVGNLYLFCVGQKISLPKRHPSCFISSAARVLEKGHLELLLLGQVEKIIHAPKQILLQAQRHAVASDLEEAILLACITYLGNNLLPILWGFWGEVSTQVDDWQHDVVRRHVDCLAQ